MNIRQLTQATRQCFPGADAIAVDLAPGRVKVTVVLGALHVAVLHVSARLGAAFLDAQRQRLVVDLLGMDPGMEYDVGYIA